VRGIDADRDIFKSDPFGYSAQGFLKWQMIKATRGEGDYEPNKIPSLEELKNPILWMSQAEALTQSAIAVIKSEPNFENMPPIVRGICDSKFCAVGLMLIGYSLEISLKAMMIIEHGTDGYLEIEKKKRHHRLHDLAEFVPNLNIQDKAVLRGLTHFVYWAGRYPDPGSGRESDASEIFGISEKHKISIKVLLSTAAKITAHISQLLKENS